jgi:hypothetical protein
MKRIAAAFLLAPVPAALIQSVVVAIWPKKGMGVFAHPASTFVAMCLLFYVFEIVLALPVYLALRKRLPLGVLAYAVAGALVTLVPISVGLLIVAARGHLSAYELIYNVGFFGFGGVLAGIVFGRVTMPGVKTASA